MMIAVKIVATTWAQFNTFEIALNTLCCYIYYYAYTLYVKGSIANE